MGIADLVGLPLWLCEVPMGIADCRGVLHGKTHIRKNMLKGAPQEDTTKTTQEKQNEDSLFGRLPPPPSGNHFFPRPN